MLGTKVPKPPPGYRGYGESNTPLVYKVMRFVPLANFLGLPAITLPIGYEDETGLPVGFQLLGNAWEEPNLIGIASVVEAYQGRRLPKAENYFDVLAPWA
jgi:Asp-tRNA(Asn)/Glu-tRNA(Gln) amidotransferase A subunit family amidase